MHKTPEQRQFDAIIRQKERDARTPQHQLARLRQQPGRSLKETTRLLANSPSDALVSPNDDLFVDYGVECTASDDGYHIWNRVADDMYECRACGAIDC